MDPTDRLQRAAQALAQARQEMADAIEAGLRAGLSTTQVGDAAGMTGANIRITRARLGIPPVQSGPKPRPVPAPDEATRLAEPAEATPRQ